jgi:hypothetical protein
MVGGALLDDCESEVSKTAITIHCEKVGCSRGHEDIKGGSITPFIRNLRTTLREGGGVGVRGLLEAPTSFPLGE